MQLKRDFHSSLPPAVGKGRSVGPSIGGADDDDDSSDDDEDDDEDDDDDVPWQQYREVNAEDDDDEDDVEPVLNPKRRRIQPDPAMQRLASPDMEQNDVLLGQEGDSGAQEGEAREQRCVSNNRAVSKLTGNWNSCWFQP